MESKAKFFFLMLMLIFFLGVLIHFLIPLQFVVSGTRKIEETYNGYKIEVEQNTVRALAYLNSKVVSNQIQIYENVRSTVIRLFETGNDYENIKSEMVDLNSAHTLANMNSTQLESVNMLASMWFIPNVTSLASLNPTQQWVMSEYCQIQAYLESMKILSQFYKGLEAIQIYINIGQQFYFQYPSRVNDKFRDINATIFNDYFSNTILNFKTQNRVQTIFVDQQTIKACSPILDGTQPFAVVCLNLDVRTVTQKITQTLQVPDFQMSSNEYYFVRPLYTFEGLARPQIISFFSSSNLSQIQVPEDAYFEQIGIQKMADLFTPDRNYLLNVMQLQKTKTYYTIPIQTYNNMDTKEICMYLVVINTFSESDLKSQSRYQQFFVVMIVPSTILLIISALTMGFIMKPLFSRLQQSSILMNDYCHYIRKNDMNLQITAVDDSADIAQIFDQLKYFNQLNKYSTSAYLQVSDHERIIRLLRAIQLFDKFGYSKVNIYQNLSQCYTRTGEYAHAKRYLKMSVDSTIYDLGGIEGITKMIKQEYVDRKRNPNKKQQTQLRNLCYKLYKFCILLFKSRMPGDTYSAQEISRNVNFLKKFDSKHSVCVQYVLCFLLQAISNLQDGASYQVLSSKLQVASELIKSAENCKRNNQQIPVQILKSYFYYFKGRLLISQGNYFEGYQSFILALDGKSFDPDLHKKIKQGIQSIMVKFEIDPIDINKIFSYLNSQDIRQQKQFIFLADASNPNMNPARFSKWKSKARKMAEHIFDNYIHPKDRIGISQFCNDLKVINNLIEKGTSQSMLKKQLLGSIKARDQTIYSHLVPNICRALQRTRNLKRQKIYIFFLKEGPIDQSIQSEDILNEIEQVENATFIFLVQEQSKRIKEVAEGFYLVDFQSFEQIDTILGGKSIKRADNVIYLF